MCGTSLYKNALGTGSFCQWSSSPLPQLQASPLIQILHFVMGLSILCAAAVIPSITTKSSLLQQLQARPKGTDPFGEHHKHPGRKFPFLVVLLESSRFFPYIVALTRYLFSLNNNYLLDFYEDDRRVKFSKFRCFAILIGAFPMLCA